MRSCGPISRRTFLLCRAAPAQIRQIVMNLILNASEAIGEKDGVINVTTSQVFGGRDLAPEQHSGLTRRRIPPAGSLGYRLRHDRGG